MESRMSAALAIRALRSTRGTQEVLTGVDLDVARGQVCALMGLSGAGKTTVLRVVAALQAFESGTVSIEDVALPAGPVLPESKLRELRRLVGMVFQGHALFEHLTVLENVSLALIHVLRWPEERVTATAMQLLGALGVAERANAYPREISGGQAQRVAIARALAPDPALLLMDEPTSALDPARRGSLAESLRVLATQGRAILISTHDVEFARACADTVAVLANGVVVEVGPANDVLTRPTHAATRELLAAPG
jgi:ABC-type polar amino acid transport system ATPase subunit